MEAKTSKTGGEDILRLPARLDEPAASLLLAEYEHVGASLLSNEETGEKRLTVFLTLIGATIAGLGLAADRFARRPDDLVTAILVASLVLWLYGLVVLRRIMERNVVTTEYLNSLRLIRASFVRQQPELAGAVAVVPGPEPLRRERKSWWRLGKAGFLETLGATNCILAAVAAGAGAWLGWSSRPAAVSLAVPAAAVAWVLQMRWAQRAYKTLTAKRAEERREALAWWREDASSPPAPPAQPAPDEEPELFRAGVGLVVAFSEGEKELYVTVVKDPKDPQFKGSIVKIANVK